MKKYTNEELTENIINMLKEKTKKDYKKNHIKREAHSKCLGLLKAQFIVNENLPKEYKIGVFKSPKTYNAFIRISNSNPKTKGDNSKDIRGFAIKLLGVDGEKCESNESGTQDFLLINTNIMPIGTLKLFHDAIYYMTKSNPLIFGGELLIQGKLVKILNLIKNMKHETSPLDVRYFSTTPYMFGDKIVKYILIPTSTYKSKLPKNLTATYLSENMQNHLKKHEATFDFLIQIQTNENEMPTNDASITWNIKKSKIVKVATLKIPIQIFATKERYKLAENLSFSPGHSLIEHRPIGDINEARVKIYEEMSKFRHSGNSEALYEPSNKDFYHIK